MSNNKINASIIKKLLNYNPETGKLSWNKRDELFFKSPSDALAWNSKYSGREAFTSSNGNGYLRGVIFKRKYYAHRICWTIYYGYYPTFHIDHINGNRIDNRIINLRDVDKFETSKNMGIGKANKSGKVGVCFDNARGKWSASICVDNDKIKLGRFFTFEDACSARDNAELIYNFHENHGKRLGFLEKTNP